MTFFKMKLHCHFLYYKQFNLNMSKSIEDYRNIIKILKLQLLKIREENSSLSHQLGIASETQNSSFTPKINHYKESTQPFAKNILSFLFFAHQCEIIGVTPEMVFRIADKSRDKKVAVSSFVEIMKRLKLRMSQTEINQFTSLIKRDNYIFYEDYLQSLSAFQVNSQKYPPKGSRTYVQLCLLKFGQQARQFKDAENLYLRLNNGEDKPYLTFQPFTTFLRRNMANLLQFEVIAVFVGLDMMSQCQIEKSIFKRQIGKVYSLLERGINLEQELSSIIVQQPKAKQPSKGKSTIEKQVVNKESIIKRNIEKSTKEDHFEIQEERGEEAGNKKKPMEKKVSEQKNPGKEIKLSPGNSKKIVDQLKKQNIRIGQFLQKLLNQQSKKGLVKSFTIFDFSQAAKAIKKDFSKKKIFELFKQLDNEKNGTIDTAEIVKLWIRAKELTDSDEILYRLLYRHLREIQYPEPSQRFEVVGVSVKENLSENAFKKVFQTLDLQDLQVQKIVTSLIGSDIPIQKFCQKLKSEGKPASAKKFTKMDQNLYKEFKAIIKRINDKRGGAGSKRWRKLMRVQETGQKSTAEDYWQTIFTDQWACWEYCLDIASNLQSFWRDHEFGPTKSDPSGIRSIVGNQSSPPPALPDQSQIQWLTFEELLLRKKIDEKVTFMEQQLNPNQVVQGNIGDCWYVSSLSIIANSQEYIKGMTYDKCKKQQQCSTFGINPYLFKFFIKYGIYVFKYFKKFQPVYVVVDDLFPVQTSTNELLFAKSPNPGMQWVAFLQKSYAKLHHAYSNMISGDISQGLNDLTNALPIKQTLDKDKREENLQKIKLLNNEQQLMGCSITPEQAAVQAPVTLDDQKCGLFYSHAYSIIDFLDLNTNDKNHFELMRVRNPWGHGQWLLDWSDTPIDNNPQYQKLKQYQKDIKTLYQQKVREAKKIGKTAVAPYESKDDGQFLMNFDDFNNLYTNLFTGFTVDSFYSKYQGRAISEKWDTKTPSGICKLKGAPEKDRIDFVKNNHQYILQVQQDDTDILMYIVQEDGRLYRGEKYPYKQLCNPTLILSFTLNNEKELGKFEQNKLTIKTLTFERRREVNLWNKFKKGRYAIVPCKMKNNIKESEFQFRIYSQMSKQIKVKKLRGSNDFQLITESTAPQIDGSSYMSFIDLLEKNTKK